LIVVCGVSGSGKTSLAIDTLYAEGQRRYIESFSAYTRQFLERLEKPAADSIQGIPAAIAVTRKSAPKTGRATIATATEIADYLRLLYANCAEVRCPKCDAGVRRHTVDSVAETLASQPTGSKYQLAFKLVEASDADDTRRRELADHLQREGFVRVISKGQTWNLTEGNSNAPPADTWLVVVDRLTPSTPLARLRESVETALRQGEGAAIALLSLSEDETGNAAYSSLRTLPTLEVDGRSWYEFRFSKQLRCEACEFEFPEVEPRLFSFTSPLGACRTCEGAGTVIAFDPFRIAGNRRKSVRDGAILPWEDPPETKADLPKCDLRTFLSYAEKKAMPVDPPLEKLSEADWQTLWSAIWLGDESENLVGLQTWFAALEASKSGAKVGKYLKEFRSEQPCPDCDGARLRPASLGFFLGGANQTPRLNIAQLSALRVDEAANWLRELTFSNYQQELGEDLADRSAARCDYLCRVGLPYLSLDRRLSALSGGEAQRVSLTAALGSNLVNMLYVLDEPTVGLHANDVPPLIEAITDLRDRGNTVVVVEHEESLLHAADQIVEIGPSAGKAGGEVVFQGTVAELTEDQETETGPFLAGRRGVALPSERRPQKRGAITLTGAVGRNLKTSEVKFPLGMLCVVSGVSGAGKSTLVQDTLYGAICQRLEKKCSQPLPYDEIFGAGQVDDCLLVDQSPIGKSPRSNPATYIKAFDGIRNVFAETLDARTRNYKASHFSFNVEGGRCPTCRGDGHLAIDMQFLADVYMRCPDCRGMRFRPEVLAVRHRGKSIADVLGMTVREAFGFFRGQPKVQSKLKQLIDVGLEYLQLGQGANTLSSGESQRLKLASYMSAASRNRTLFLLDEPTTGLHFSDVVRLLDCFDTLLAVGHSLIVVEHNMQLLKAADWIIDLGPDAGEDGGEIVAEGTPEEIAANANSPTAVNLKAALSRCAR